MKTNLPTGPLRWTISKAAKELQVDREALSLKLQKLGHAPEDGGFSTRQIFSALTQGDTKEARTLQILQDTERSRQQTEGLKMRNEAFRAELYDASTIKHLLGAWLTAAVQIIKSAQLPDHKENELLEQLTEGMKRAFEEAETLQKEKFAL
jgi:hypothetical protein